MDTKEEKEEKKVAVVDAVATTTTTTDATDAITAARLAKIGLHAAATKLDKAAKISIAYSKYLFIAPDRIKRFNELLKKETLEEDNWTRHFKQLSFIKLRDYPEIPPVHVLDAIEEAQAVGCFDAFEVAKIEWIKEIKDPIVFGIIDGCEDKFFIAQWDDDVNIDQIMFSE